MLPIFISAEAYGVIKTKLLDPTPLPSPGDGGLIPIWLDPPFVDRMTKMRAPGESYSDVILRLAKTRS